MLQQNLITSGHFIKNHFQLLPLGLIKTVLNSLKYDETKRY